VNLIKNLLEVINTKIPDTIFRYYPEEAQWYLGYQQCAADLLEALRKGQYSRDEFMSRLDIPSDREETKGDASV
jgi:hypothetical protein